MSMAEAAGAPGVDGLMSGAQAANVNPARCIDTCHLDELIPRILKTGQLVACCSSMQFFSVQSPVKPSAGHLCVMGH